MADNLHRRPLPARHPIPEGKTADDFCIMQTVEPIEIGGQTHHAATWQTRDDGESQEHLEQRCRAELQAYIDASRRAGRWGG